MADAAEAGIEEQKEQRFGQIALERGLVDEERLARCFGIRSELARRGNPRRIGEIMIVEKLITKAQALEILKAVHAEAGDRPRIGGYELKEKLGAGAMGTVYRARQVSMDRDVALKLLPRRLSEDPEFVEKFLLEAKTSARLGHLNIVRAIDVGESNGYHYFAMEFVDGQTLAERLKRDGPLDEDAALDIARQAVAGLAHAADVGVVHRDIKPSNLMLCHDGVVKIADMGLAVVVDSTTVAARADEEGKAAGTPYYMAPEQVEGKSDLDPRTDMYALGATLYESVTGQKPWTGTSPSAIMAKRLLEDPPDAHETAPEAVSESFSAVIRKMMARSREARYATFADLLADLEALTASRTPEALRALRSPPAEEAEEPAEAPASRPRRSSVRKRAPSSRRKAAARPRRRAPAAAPARRLRGHERPQQRPLGILIMAGVSVLVLAGLGFLLTNRERLRGPRHPVRSVQWAPPTVTEAEGPEIRAAWIKARNALYGDGEPNLDAEARAQLEALARSYPASAYGAWAKALLEEYGDG